MFKLEDGRENLWQWDLDRRVIIEDKNVCEVHFCNRTTECSLVVEPFVNEKGEYVANIPNIILQEARPIRVYAYIDDKYTLVEEQISVKSRTRPDDYTYTETQVTRWESLFDRAEQAVETAEKTMEEVNSTATDFYDYVEGHEFKFVDDNAGNVTVEGIYIKNYVTQDDVDEAVQSALENVELPNYYTKEEVDSAITEAINSIDTTIPEEYITETELENKGYLTEHQSLEGYAKTTDIPTDEHINSLINDALGVIENGTY